MKNHVDNKWIDEKIGGHGGAYSYDGINSRAKIEWIFGKNFIQIWWYNVVLFIKYLNRNIIKNKKG